MCESERLMPPLLQLGIDPALTYILLEWLHTRDELRAAGWSTGSCSSRLNPLPPELPSRGRSPGAGASTSDDACQLVPGWIPQGDHLSIEQVGWRGEHGLGDGVGSAELNELYFEIGKAGAHLSCHHPGFIASGTIGCDHDF